MEDELIFIAFIIIIIIFIFIIISPQLAELEH